MDRVLGLTMLLAYDSRREARLTSLSVSPNNLKIAAFADMMARFFGLSLPLGMHEKGTATTALPSMLSSPLERKNPEGKYLYNRVVEKLNDTADPVALIRNALTAQQDQNAAVILAGPPVNLLGLLSLPGTKQLIQKKVRALTIAAPFNDAAGFSRLLSDWPGPVVAAGEDIQEAVQFPEESFETDFTWAANHPLLDAYRASKAMPYDASSSTIAAILHTVRPEENYFRLSDPGMLTFSAGARLQFTVNSQGKHRRLIADPMQKERIVQACRQVVSSKPPEPRRGRGAQP